MTTHETKENKQLVASPVERLKSVMLSKSVSEQFQNALADNSNLFVASVIDLFASDTYLQKCDPKLVVLECLKAATLKLPINKSLGMAYVVPYKGVPQFQIGYRGLIQLAMRSGIYRIINADIVYAGEFKGRSKLTGEVDISGGKTSDDVVGYFAHVEATNGFKKTLYMSKVEIEEHGKKYSQSYAKDTSPWKKNFDQMALKTTLRLLLSKYGLLSVEMASAMDSEEDSLSPAGQLTEDITKNANKDFLDIEAHDKQDPPENVDLKTGEITPPQAAEEIQPPPY